MKIDTENDVIKVKFKNKIHEWTTKFTVIIKAYRLSNTIYKSIQRDFCQPITESLRNSQK